MEFLNDPLGALGLGPSAGMDSGTLTPEAIELRRKMALAMMEGAQKEPVKSTTQGLNSVLKSIVGAYQLKQADKADLAGKKEADDLLAKMFGGGSLDEKPSVAAKPAETSRPFSAGGYEAASGPSADIAPYANAIAAVESADAKDPYTAIGPRTRSGDRAIGKYQVMGKNIPEWTEKHLGRRLSVREFMADPDAQEKVFASEFGGYLKKYGNPDDAASMWFTGKPAAEGRDRNDLYTSQPEYLRRFNAALKKGDASPVAQAAGDGVREVSMPSTEQTSATVPSNPNLMRALMLMRNPRTAPIGQALLQKALTAETKDPLIVKVPGPDGAEVGMIYDRATNTLKPLTSLMGGSAGESAADTFSPVGGAPAPAQTAPAAAMPVMAQPEAVQNIGEVGPGPLELAAMTPNSIGGQVSNAAAKGNIGGPAPVAPPPPPVLLNEPAPAAPTPAPQMADLPEGAQFGPQWKGKLPEGYIHRQSADGRWLYDRNRQPLTELKSGADARAKADEKRGEASVESDQQRSGVRNIIATGRNLTQQPGFDDALRLGRADTGGLPLPYSGGEGVNPAQAAYKIARATNPNSPTWGVMDDIKATQERLKAVVARPLFKGQGNVSNSERQLIAEMIGSLSQATSKADYQFRLNSVERMIDDMYAGTMKGASTYTARPTTEELKGALTAPTPEAIEAKVVALSKKYNVPRNDMADYVMSQWEFIGKPGEKKAEAATKKQPQSVLEAMMARVGL